MTREEAIRILDPETTEEALAEIEYYAGFRGKEASIKAVEDACILAVAALREQEQRRWIPVTDRLPDSDDFVLVIASGIVGNITLDNAIELAAFSEVEGWILEMWPELEDPKVTHWMPVPEPPKEMDLEDA